MRRLQSFVNLWWCYQIKTHIFLSAIHKSVFYGSEEIVNVPRRMKKVQEILLLAMMSHIFIFLHLHHCLSLRCVIPEYYFINFDIWRSYVTGMIRRKKKFFFSFFFTINVCCCRMKICGLRLLWVITWSVSHHIWQPVKE